MAGAEWNEVLDNLTQSFKSRLPSIDRHDLVSFCVDNKHIRSAVYKYLRSFKKTNTKSATHSLAKYKQGQILYNENKYDCLSSFNESIAYATKNDSGLSEIYNSRSLVLYQLGHATESLRDLEMALESGHSEDSEVILRKARCLVKLGIFGKAEDIVSKEDSPKLKEEIKKVNDLGESNLENRLPSLKGGENENFACASSHINVFYNSEKGRHVIASQDIHPGDVLFVERPYAFVLFRNVCHNCCKNTIAPIFCWECVDAGFCSPGCRDDCQKTFHQFECGFNDLFKSIGIAHLSLRIILKASSSLDELKEVLAGIEKTKYEDGILLPKNTNYEAVYNLVHNMGKYDVLDLFQYSVTAVLIALHLKENTNYMGGASSEDVKLVAGIVLRHILQMVCNGHAINNTFLDVYQSNSIYIETEERVGTAIYPSASMMNHSCEPSVISSFRNNVLVVRAAKEIRKGEEVYNCYGPHARRMRRSKRREMLEKQYFFTCRCDACLHKRDAQELFTAFKCPECAGAFVPVDDNSQNWMCVACCKISKISKELLQKEISFYSLLKEGENIPDENVTLRLRTFLRIWQLGREIFYKFNRDLSYAADEVARCLAIMEDFRRCVLFLRCSVLSVETRFGSFSIELAKEMKKLADAILSYSLDCKQNVPRETVQEGLQYYERAERIISLLYGSDHHEVEEIKLNSQILKRKFSNENQN